MLSVLDMLSQKHTQVFGFDPQTPYMLEVAQVFDDEIIDVQLFHVDREVTMGSDVGRRLRLVGKPIAWVPQSFSVLSILMYPFLQTQDEWKSSFFSPHQQKLISWNQNKATIHLPKGWTCWHQTQKGKKEVISSSRNTKIIEPGEHIIIKGGDEWFSLRYVHPPQSNPIPWFSNIDGGSVGIAAAVMLSFLTFWYGVQQQRPQKQEESIEVALKMFEATARIREAPMPEEKIIVSKKIAMTNAKKQSKRKSNKAFENNTSGGTGISKSKVVNDFISGLNFGSPSEESSDLIGAAIPVGSLMKNNGSRLGGKIPGDWNIGDGGDGTGPMGLDPIGVDGGRTRTGSHLNPPPRRVQKLIKTSSNPTILGGLDKSSIDTVIKRNIAQIRYCYQKELFMSPNLSGKVVVKFVIAKDGSVSRSSVSASTLKSSKVEDCILNRFMKFSFQQPKGGIVIVKYPFVFQSID